MNVTRRKVLGGAAAAAFTPLSAARATAQEIIDVFRINDNPRTPDDIPYDMFAWAGDGYLAFANGEDIARWGDVDAGEHRDVGLYDQLVDADNLYTNLVRDVTVTTPIAALFVGLIGAFAFFAVKLRSVIVAGLWLLMVLSFVMAVLVDTSLVYFWVAVALGSVGLVAAVMEASRS